jgi:Helicase conserved C-terminal domain
LTHEALAQNVDKSRPLAYFERAQDPVDSLKKLASLTEIPTGIRALIHGLDATSTDLLRSLAWSTSGTFTEFDFDAEPVAHGLRVLTDAMLVTSAAKAQPYVRIPPEVELMVTLPGISLRDAGSGMTSDYFANVLHEHGVKSIPARRDERVQALVELLTNEQHVRRVVSTLSDAAQATFERLVENIAPVSVHSAGLYLSPTMQREYRSYYAERPEYKAAHELYDLGLIGLDTFEQVVWVWREVVQTVRPMLTTLPPIVARPEVISVPAQNRLAYPISTLERLFDAWRAEPPDALADGGLGVGPIRKVAKQLKVDASHIGLLVNLAARLSLLRCEVVRTEGRGRNAREIMKWKVSDSAAKWSVEPAMTRWSTLVFAWLKDRSLNDLDGLPERVHIAYFETDTLHRQLVIRELESLGFAGDQVTPAGVNSKQFEEWMAWRRPTVMSSAGVHAVVDALRALGLATDGSDLALTPNARLLLRGEGVVGETPEADAQVVVQGDYSIIVFPGVSVETQMFVDRIAELESEAGARLYRLTEASLRSAMDGGMASEDIEARLTSSVSVSLPQSVSYFIADVARKRQTAVVTGAVTVIASSDPALIAAAVRVKSAGLRAIGLYTAVSMITPEKVRSALLAKGVHVTLEAAVEDPKVAAKKAKLEREREEQQRISLELMRKMMARQYPDQKHLYEEELPDDVADGPAETHIDRSPYLGVAMLTDAAIRIKG